MVVLSYQFPLTHYRPAMPFGNRKKKLENLFNSVLSQLKKHNPSGNLKIINLRIFQSSKLRILFKKIPSNSSKAKFHSKYFGLLWVKNAFLWFTKCFFLSLKASTQAFNCDGINPNENRKGKARHLFSSTTIYRFFFSFTRKLQRPAYFFKNQILENLIWKFFKK